MMKLIVWLSTGFLLTGLLLTGLLLAPSSWAQSTGDAPPAKLILLAWDGGADWVVDRLLAEGRMPNLAKMAARGVAADYSTPPFPSKTAVSHASLWTGCWPSVHGITSNSVPPLDLSNATIRDSLRGFDSTVLTAEPLYLTAALNDRSVVILSSTHSDPAEPHLEAMRAAGIPEDRLVTFSGFTRSIAADQVYGADLLSTTDGSDWTHLPLHAGQLFAGQFTVADSPFAILAFDDPANPTVGVDSLLLRRAPDDPAQQTILLPQSTDSSLAAWSPPIAVQRGDVSANTFFRLFELAPDGSQMLLFQRDASPLGGAFTAEQHQAYLEAYPGFHHRPYRLYQRGRLGTPLMAGGDGTAEQRIVEMAAFDTQMLRRGTGFAVETWQPDVLFHYSQIADDAGHTWMGVLDPASPWFEPALAEKLWPYYAAIFGELDGWLGDVLELAGEDTVVALVADHGMAGTARDVNTNRILEQAGLLHRSEAGGIDLSKTHVLAAEAAFFVRLHDKRWLGGLVEEADREATLVAARDALLAARDPRTGQVLFSRVHRADQLGRLGLDCPHCGDLYLEPAPGYYPSNRLADDIVSDHRDSWGAGNHGFWPEQRTMHSIFYVSGPGVRQGARIPGIRHVDIAPTLARLLEIPAPAQSCGTLLRDVMEGGVMETGHASSVDDPAADR